MKRTGHSAMTKLGLRPDEVASALGSVQLLRAMITAGWIRPVIQRHKLTLYDAGDVARAWSRILNGENPFDSARSERR